MCVHKSNAKHRRVESSATDNNQGNTNMNWSGWNQEIVGTNREIFLEGRQIKTSWHVSQSR